MGFGSLQGFLDDPEAERVYDVVLYARDAGDRPPVQRWIASH